MVTASGTDFSNSLHTFSLSSYKSRGYTRAYLYYNLESKRVKAVKENAVDFNHGL